MMTKRWELKPNLLDCILEERIAPAIANLGVIALTTSGYSLVTPFPGASNSAAGSLGSGSSGSSTAASVSGAAMPTSFYVTGSRGISTFTPGNFTGNPAVGGAVTGAGGPTFTIQVGSGSDEAGGPSPAPTVARGTVGDNGLTAPTLAYIGQVSTSSDSSPPPSGGMPASTQSAPVPSLPPMGVVIPGSPSGSSSSPSMPMSPQGGAPTLMPGLGRGLGPMLPGGLGIQGGLMGPGAGGY
jgi:hypothetical protein